LFKEDSVKPELLSIDKTGTIEKKQLIRLKKIAKDIKKRKAGFKFIPFAVTAGFLAALFIVVVTFKDIIVKKGITSAMQEIFQAKTDIDYVHIEFLNSKLQIKNLQQANPDEEMKNLFQIGEITLDFNLTELLKGKVDIQNVTVAEILVNTDRTKSGKLIKKEKKSKDKEAKEPKQVNPKLQIARDDLLKKTQNTLDGMFADYNPQNIIENMQANLKSPEVAEKAQKTVEELIAKWQDEPEKIEKSVKEVQAIYEKATAIDYQNLNDPVKIKELIDLVTNGINTGNKIAEETKSTVDKIQVDANSVTALSKEISNAIQADKKLIDEQIGKFTVLKDKGLKSVFNDLITAFVYGMADQYSPYARQALDKAMEIKANNASDSKAKAEKKKAAKKKNAAQRAPGRNIYYKNDTVPKFLLENAYGSGSNWSFSAKEFSSDADKRNKQSELSANLDILGTQNKLNAVIDARTQTSSPFIDAVYDGNNIPFNVTFDSYGLNSNSAIQCNFDAGKNGSVAGTGTLNLSEVQILTPAFEPKIVYDIYSDAINSVKTMKIQLGYTYSEADGLVLTIDTNAAEIFQTMFTSAFNKAISTIADEAQAKATKLLSEKTGLATEKIEQFTDIKGLITDTDATLKKMQKELDKLLKDLTDQLKAQAENEIKKQAEEQLKNLPIDENLKKGMGFFGL
ncbi:MAG: hypothetical protein K6A89_11040, partial [Treponema sp.]|nr:hypothetical protein [Treponema sp.]